MCFASSCSCDNTDNGDTDTAAASFELYSLFTWDWYDDGCLTYRLVFLFLLFSLFITCLVRGNGSFVACDVYCGVAVFVVAFKLGSKAFCILCSARVWWCETNMGIMTCSNGISR